MSNYIINQIQLLDKSLNKCNYDINNNISKLNKLTIQKLQYNNMNDIISYVKQLNKIRFEIKNIILKNELIIYDIDKKKIINENTTNNSDYTNTENQLYEYNFINENIKKTLKNIIIKIK